MNITTLGDVYRKRSSRSASRHERRPLERLCPARTLQDSTRDRERQEIHLLLSWPHDRRRRHLPQHRSGRHRRRKRRLGVQPFYARLDQNPEDGRTRSVLHGPSLRRVLCIWGVPRLPLRRFRHRFHRCGRGRILRRPQPCAAPARHRFLERYGSGVWVEGRPCPVRFVFWARPLFAMAVVRPAPPSWYPLLMATFTLTHHLLSSLTGRLAEGGTGDKRRKSVRLAAFGGALAFGWAGCVVVTATWGIWSHMVDRWVQWIIVAIASLEAILMGVHAAHGWWKGVGKELVVSLKHYVGYYMLNTRPRFRHGGSIHPS